MTKFRRTSLYLVPFALCAMGVSAFIFAGCERAGQKSEPPRHAPESYMNDPAFRQQLADAREARQGLAASRNAVVAKMTAMIEAKKKELKTDDLQKVKAALEQDPEWQSLYKRCLDANQAIKENRKKAMGVVRERITPVNEKQQNGKISK